MDDTDGLILLESFTFPDYWKVQAWLKNTGNDAKFRLVMAEIEKINDRGGYSGTYTISALDPIDKKEAFLWKLKGPTAVKKLEQEILDFADNINYNV